LGTKFKPKLKEKNHLSYDQFLVFFVQCAILYDSIPSFHY